ncbi:MAG: hypothetical protein GY821_05685 [Gammaproteobacteria bacterium]|nr:hypothetical protein [Gammaproteobacteria bacterium]
MLSDDVSKRYKRVYQLTQLFTEDEIVEKIKEEIYQQILAEEYRRESQIEEVAQRLPTIEEIEERSRFIKAELQGRFNEQV